MQTIAFLPMLLQTMAGEAQAAYPNEICGILIGRDAQGPHGDWRLVERMIQTPNVFSESERFHRFAINPRDLLHAQKAAGFLGQIVLGFYHSHPDHPERPSSYDTERAWPTYSYIIISVQKGKASGTACWLFDESTRTFTEQSIVDMTPIDNAAD